MTLDVLTDDRQVLDVALGGLNSLLGQLEAFDQLRQLLFAESSRVAPLVVNTLRHACLHRWEEMCRVVASGRGSEVHAERSGIVELVRRDRATLDRVDQLVRLTAQVVGKVVPGAAEISTAIAELERFQTDVLDRWQTLEDLEELAVEHYPLSAAKLEELAVRYPAPQAWYDEAAATS